MRILTLQIQPMDVQYRSRVWAKKEFDQLQLILQQLYPYCLKLNQVRENAYVVSQDTTLLDREIHTLHPPQAQHQIATPT